MDIMNRELADAKRDLLTCLDGIQTTGNIAISQHYDSFVHPGLMVANTLIQLPLATRDAQMIKNASRQAPFGRGEETVLDTSARNTWELDHTEFKFTNPGWDAYVTTLVADVAEGLGIPITKVEPYKLLLHEEGSFLKPHEDSEKFPGVIATMVICLPSKHAGGSVHISNRNNKNIFETDKTSDFGLTMLSWFSDATHEVKPLESGYRLELTYNIIHSDGPRMSAGLVGTELDQVRLVLTRCMPRLAKGIHRLIYKLEHRYKRSSLSLSNLKGRDKGMCQSLYRFSSEYRVTILLARLNRIYIESSDYEDDEEDKEQEEMELEDVKTCDGNIAFKQLSVSENHILGNMWNRRIDCCKEGYFIENESMTSMYPHNHTDVVEAVEVVVIFPGRTLSDLNPRQPHALTSLASETLCDYHFIPQLSQLSKISGWSSCFVRTLKQGAPRQLICGILRAIYKKRDAKVLADAKGMFLSILDACTKRLVLQPQHFPASKYVTALNKPGGPLNNSARTIKGVLGVIEQCFDMKLTNQATELLDMSCTNIYKACSKPEDNPLPGPIVARDFLLSLVLMLQKHGVTPFESFENMFMLFLREILASHPPTCPRPPHGWAHKPRPKCSQDGSCEDCKDLNDFLENPEMEVGEFCGDPDKRQHLERQLPMRLFRCQSAKEPEKLIVRKLGNEFKEDMKDYKTKLSLFENRVRVLRCEYVESLLGEELYGELVLLKCIPDSDGAKGSKHAEKRKAEDELEGPASSRPMLIE
ncbi:uncharacterized protein GGS22DRAFT_197140 [Annulohypoxylon maeteangense]|uniref:uncharacterized protein n=1 Tax=Annulohypoxylon maeteangense TaxID=1927788 RepID=UPI002008C928|nr:uncharacterized protein GGS22DRAFT_197140 [Annulohypoxylon maeteangense]KAI0881085.1 hypothetical protein GGS22DRAFT_197140 [Annulohypoxylon maeteangense]